MSGTYVAKEISEQWFNPSWSKKKNTLVEDGNKSWQVTVKPMFSPQTMIVFVITVT